MHLYWFMRNWWQSWPSVWVYVHVIVHRLHTCNVHMCTCNVHMCTRAILYTCDTHYLRCLPSLFLLSLPLTSLPPSLLPSPPSHLTLPFLPHTSLHSYLSPVQITSYRPVVLYDHLTFAILDGRHVAVVIP